MLKVGLTGGIGSGKSTAVDAFRTLRIPIIDADRIAKDLVKKGQQTLNKIESTFGKSILLASGELDRKALKEIVFAAPDLLAKLEAILHPSIKTEIHQKISALENLTHPIPYVVVDIPLLVEKNYQDIFDDIIVVDCSIEQQIARVIHRDQLDKKTINNIIDLQADREERIKIANHILDNSKTIQYLIQQVNNLHTKLISKSGINH
ncbi:MAG: dephospho-CoA kinase [Cocleimonas sp.]